MNSISYINNKKAANELFKNIQKGYKYCRLFAEMQSGKTKVISYLIEKVLKTKKFDKIIFLLSDSSIDLTIQNKNSINEHLKNSGITNYNDKVLYYHRPNIKKFILENNINIRDILKGRILLIIDESHMAALEDQLKDLLQNPLGFAFNIGPSKWKNKKLALVTVSATPFPEEFAHLNEDNFYKKDNLISKGVKLIPGKNYYGIKQMLANKVLFNSSNIYEKNNINFTKNFSNFLMDFMINAKTTKPFENLKYKTIIRTSKKKNNISLEKDIRSFFKNKTNKEIVFSYCDQERNDNIKEVMECNNDINKLHFIILKQKARAGLNLNTQYVYSVWDNYSKQTHVVAQSLAGRCCGYNKENHNVKIYTNVEQLIKFSNWTLNKLNTNILNNKKQNNFYYKTLKLIKGKNNVEKAVKKVSKYLYKNKILIHKENKSAAIARNYKVQVKKGIHLDFINNIKKYIKENGSLKGFNLKPTGGNDYNRQLVICLDYEKKDKAVLMYAKTTKNFTINDDSFSNKDIKNITMPKRMKDKYEI